MPQATDELQKLMGVWFGDEIDDGNPARFLISRGYFEKAGVWYPPVPAHNATPEEFACLRFLADEWDYDFHLINPFPEDVFKPGHVPSPTERAPCSHPEDQLEQGYGLAGGGLGVYTFCNACGQIINKIQTD